jgi:hypothetical protein
MRAEGDVIAWRPGSVCLNVVVELWNCKAYISLQQTGLVSLLLHVTSVITLVWLCSLLR